MQAYVQNGKQATATTRKQSGLTKEAHVRVQSVHPFFPSGPCAECSLVGSFLSFLAVVLIVLPPLLLAGLVLRWAFVGSLTLSEASRSSRVPLAVVRGRTRKLSLPVLGVLLAGMIALGLAALVAAGRRARVAGHAALRRLTVPAAGARSLLMPPTAAAVPLGLLRRHLEVRRVERLLGRERDPVPLFELVEDVLRVALLRVDLATVDNLLDFLDQDRPLLVVRDVEGALHDVVGELVVDHLGEAELGVGDLDADYPVQDHAFAALRGELKAFLDDVRAELVQAVGHDVVNDLIDDKALLLESAALQDVRDHVVPELVRRQLGYHAQDLVGDGLDLASGEPFHDALHNAAPILVLAELGHLGPGQLDDEVGHVVRGLGDDPLDDVVTLRVVHALDEHLLVQLAYEHALALLRQHVEGLLDHAAAVLVEGEVWHLLDDAIEQLVDALLAAILEDHLHHEVAKDIPHEALGRLGPVPGPTAGGGKGRCVDYVLLVLADLCEEGVPVLGGASALDLLLDEPRALLIATEVAGIAKHFLQGHRGSHAAAREAVVLLLVWRLVLLLVDDNLLDLLEGRQRGPLAGQLILLGFLRVRGMLRGPARARLAVLLRVRGLPVLVVVAGTLRAVLLLEVGSAVAAAATKGGPLARQRGLAWVRVGVGRGGRPLVLLDWLRQRRLQLRREEGALGVLHLHASEICLLLWVHRLALRRPVRLVRVGGLGVSPAASRHVRVDRLLRVHGRHF